MKFFENPLYIDDIQKTAALDLPWEKLQGRSLIVSGASGMIGSFLIDVIMKKNEEGLGCKVYAMGRNREKLCNRFASYTGSEWFEPVIHDINQPMESVLSDRKVDFVFHLASATHPVAYASDPIGTITTNILGMKNMLDFAARSQSERVVFASSNEIYGENRGDAELFDESYCGYIDCNTLRAGYPESKRCSEALCQAYISQKNIDVLIARFTRSYGPSMLSSDTKAISQFIKKAIRGEDIVLKSKGNQFYSYTYVADAVSGLLYILMKGESGAAYNIADLRSDITLKDLAGLIAGQVGKEVVFELPDAVEASGYSKATKARLDSKKLAGLGWSAQYAIQEGIQRTISILKQSEE